MANTQTSVPVFTAGQVLTAAQMTEINTGIPVFATTTTRDAAFGGTGEKTLAEGQFAYIEASNATQYYDGAAWQSLGSYTYITGASFSAVTTLSMAAGVFTSTYKNYMVTFNITSASADYDLDIRVNNAGAARTATNYIGGSWFVNNGGSGSGAGTNGLGYWNDFIRGTTAGAGATIMVYDPTNASSKTTITTHGGSSYLTVSGGVYNVAEANDGLTILTAGANTITGFYRVYGLGEA